MTPIPAPQAIHKESRSRLFLLILAGIALIVAAAYALREAPPTEPGTAAPSAKATEPSGHEAEGPTVQVMKPQRRDMAYSLTLPANIAPWYQTTLYAKVSGYLSAMHVDKGDEVKKGQLLALIDAPEVKDLYEQAQADYEIKNITFQRLSGVFRDNPDVIAKQDVDVAEAAAKAARHLRDTRRTLLGYTRVEAPFDGTITARFADPGALIQAATGSASQSTPLYTLMSLDTVRIYVSVPQEDAHFALPGVAVTLVGKDPGFGEIKGTITRSTEALDPTTRTLLVEIDLPNKDRRLQPGMYVTAVVFLKEHKQALALPPAAIIPPGGGQQGKSVYAVDQGRARRIPVTTGIDDGLWVEITQGLTGDEDIVVVGRSSVTEGHAVRAKPYNLPAGKPGAQKL